MNSNFRTHLMSKIAPCIASILAFLLVMALILTFLNLEVRTRAQARQMEALNTLSTIRANLEGALNVTVLAARGLVALVLIRPEITADEFEKMARELMSRQKRVRNIGLGFGTTLKYVYPIKGSKYPPAEPEALRSLPPQRGLSATEKRGSQRLRSCRPGYRNKERRNTPGYVKLWQSPRQSRGFSYYNKHQNTNLVLLNSGCFN